jgi:predicted nucleic acid-binding protein
MTFADIPGGAAVFLDANTFIYHFVSEPTYGAACTSFLERVERREVEGWVSAHVLAEVSHRLMTIEACSVFGWPYEGIASRLRRNADHIKRLDRFRQSLAEIDRLDLHLVSIDQSHVMRAAALSREYGLMTNDALLVAAMQSRGLANLVSNDADFDRVPGVVRFAPI